jgi:LysM repeat protein
MNVDFTVTASRVQTIEMVNSIGYEEENKKDLSSYPSVTVKRAMPNENLWKLAKRYNSTQTLIAEANGLEDPNLEYGQLLIIPKKR